MLIHTEDMHLTINNRIYLECFTYLNIVYCLVVQTVHRVCVSLSTHTKTIVHPLFVTGMAGNKAFHSRKKA